MKRARYFASALALVGFAVLLAAAAAPAATPKEAVGFFGTVTGVVKSARPDGSSFVLTVSEATPDAKSNTAKDPAAMAGKDLTLGTRMPRVDGKPSPSPEDVAYIKSLKPGETITVKVFAVRSDPSVLRIMGPGTATTRPAGAEKGK